MSNFGNKIKDLEICGSLLVSFQKVATITSNDLPYVTFLLFKINKNTGAWNKELQIRKDIDCAKNPSSILNNINEKLRSVVHVIVVKNSASSDYVLKF